MQQRTLQKQITLSGTGLHTGYEATIVMKPADIDSGITFVLDGVRIPALYSNVSAPVLSTNLTVGNTTVNTVEHIMAALSATRIDNVDIEITQYEVPIMDGSADIFLTALMDTGIDYQDDTKKFIKVDRRCSYREGTKSISVSPSPELIIEMSVDFDHPAVGFQKFVYVHSLDNCKNQLAPAKTFCFERDIEAMRNAGLIKGGSVDNAVVYGNDGALNEVRFSDEPVRHKILDMVGDLYTAGYHIKGHFVVHGTGHAFTNQFLQYFMRDAVWHME